MMIKQQKSHKSPSYFQSPTNQFPDTVTSSNYVTSTAMNSEFEFMYQKTVASNNPCMNNQSANDILDHELKSNLSELVHQTSKEESTSSDDELIHKVIDRRYVGERKEESNKVIQKERECETQTDGYGKIEIKRNKIKMERLSKRWKDRQICRECEDISGVRQKHKKGDEKEEQHIKLERQMETQVWYREQNIKKQKQVTKKWQVRQVGTESENERKAEEIKSVEIEPHTLAQVNGLGECERDLQESKTEKVRISTEKEKDGGVDTKKILKEEHYPNEKKVNRGLLQRNESERDSKKRADVHSHSAPFDPEEQMCPTEVSRLNNEQEKYVCYYLLNLHAYVLYMTPTVPFPLNSLSLKCIK